MAFFKRRKTMKRCMALQSYVHGINSDTARKMTDFLMQNKRNYICTNRQFLMFVTGAGGGSPHHAHLPHPQRYRTASPSHAITPKS